MSVDEQQLAAAPPRGWRALEPSHRFLLVVLGATSFFDGYDRGLISIALPQIRATYRLTQSAASGWIAVLFLGAVPAVVLARSADRIGRRRLLLISIVGYSLATAATAFAPGVASYVACQFVARIFLTAESAVVWVMVAEELPASARGLGFGWLAANAALGFGAGAIVYGAVFTPLNLSWRWLYLLGLPPLTAVALLRRRLPETRRFADARLTGQLHRRWHEILRPQHRRALALVLATAFLLELTTQASVFALDFLQTDRGLSVARANFLLVAAGIPAIPIMVIAGALSDRFGRRAVGCGFGALGLVGAAGFFWLPGGVPVLWPSLTLVIAGQLGSWPALAGYSSELFPTGLRGQAGSWVELARVAGDSASLGLGAVLLTVTGTFPRTVTLLALGPAAAIVIVATLFPDTHGRELEEITPAAT
ncbi:MAG: transporter, putative metabolite:H+ symporter [Actinomycetota bacterium]|jgi:putative MFS transporter